MEQLVTKKDLIKKIPGLKNSILGIYLKKGLIPYPEVKSNYNGRKGRTGLYPVWVIDRIKEIRKLTGEGHTLDFIKKEFEDRNPGNQRKYQQEAKKKIIEILNNDHLSREEIDRIQGLMFRGWAAPTGPENANDYQIPK